MPWTAFPCTTGILVDQLLIARAHQQRLTLVMHDSKLSAYAISLLWQWGLLRTRRQWGR
jgi:hypothetical protein